MAANRKMRPEAAKYSYQNPLSDDAYDEINFDVFGRATGSNPVRFC